MEPTIRLYQPEDLPALQQLWEQDSRWGVFPWQWWRHRFLDGPRGPSLIVVMTDSRGQVVGQCIFMPMLVTVKGQQILAARPSAVILARDARRSLLGVTSSTHPVMAMCQYAASGLQARGDRLLFLIADPRWERFMRGVDGVHFGLFPLWSRSLPLATPLPLDDRYSVEPLTEWSAQIDRLWEQWSSYHGCLVVRDRQWLSWKIGGSEYAVIGIRRNRELVGLAAAQQKGDRQWLICDLLAADMGDSLHATLSAALNLAHHKAVAADPQRPFHKVAILATSAMEPVLSSLDFVRDAYDFPLVVYILDPRIAPEDVVPARWYLSAND